MQCGKRSFLWQDWGTDNSVGLLHEQVGHSVVRGVRISIALWQVRSKLPGTVQWVSVEASRWLSLTLRGTRRAEDPGLGLDDWTSC